MATVTIQKRKCKDRNSYIVRFKVPLTGDKKHFKTFRKYKEAQQAANELRALLDSGKLPEPKKTKLNPLTFDFVAISLEREWRDRLKKQDLAQKTFEEYSIWLRVLKRTFGKRILCQISKDEIQSYVNNIAFEQTNVSANKYLSIIKKVFTHGFTMRAVIYDPTKEIKYLSEKSHTRDRFLLPHELNNLISATQGIHAKFYLPAIIYLGAEHGASKQEILSLTWSRIDFEFSDYGLINFFRTKNHRERTEFLMPRTKEALLKWRDHLKWMRHRKKITEIKSDYVFCRLDGTPMKNFSNAWQRLLEIARIKNFHFHDLRHTFCSNLILSGSNIKDVKEMIGHGDISMTDRYSHLTLQHQFERQKQLADHYTNSK